MVGEFLNEGSALLTRKYPEFVYQPNRKPRQLDYLPIFTFHSIDPTDFESKLMFLDGNGYRTITLCEAVAWVHVGAPIPDRAVVLTIDDGRLSTWSTAYPLLKKYQMCATAFVIPGYLQNVPARLTLDDVWSGDVPIDHLRLGESDDRATVLSWSEVESLHHSDVVQIESHSMLHRRVFISGKLVGFVNPSDYGSAYRVPLPRTRNIAWTNQALQDNLGMPKFQSRPVMEVASIYDVPTKVFEPCQEFVRTHGGANFFDNRDWRRQLNDQFAKTKNWHASSVDSADIQEWELRQSKAVLEQRLRKQINHFCFPSGAGSSTASSLSREAGYASNLWGMLPANESNRSGSDPYHLGRLKHDFIYRLPGDGRKSLTAVMRQKILRRVQGNTGF